MKAIILAAGSGKRIGRQANGQPKCMLELGGKPLLERHFVALENVGIRDVIVVVGYEREQITTLVQQIGQAGCAKHTLFLNESEPNDDQTRAMSDDYRRNGK